MTQGTHPVLYPPLGDRQTAIPAWYCSQCGGEQYRWDRKIYRLGRLTCVRCLSQLEKEEDKSQL